MDAKKYAGPSKDWLERTDEIEETCLSIAAAGLAAELGMIDRELLGKSRTGLESVVATSAPSRDAR